MPNAYLKMSSPVGQLTLVASETALKAVLWENEKPGRVPIELGPEKPDHPVLKAAAKQLNAYFKGEITTFDLPLDPVGSAFQLEVWRTLATIPYGQTLSYGELALRVGRPKAARAVGAANGKNPLSIVLPCHRVIGANGQLTGFANGLEAKSKLLALENPNK
ncbi:MAG: methylated-DNA--[protein]-cysteine S-methyltransferase [Candidatus Sericytochromatia bacterium]|nr:methylated-DNA--[protein]-cysteine S-methyltransferase [Candidatus Sericytochromatia bacterium]